MRTKIRRTTVLIAALTLIAVVSGAVIAMAAGSLSLTASPTNLYYGKVTKLNVYNTGTSAAAPATVTVQYSWPTTSTWFDLRSITSSVTTYPPIVTKPSRTTLYRAKTGTTTPVYSDVVTVTVKAVLKRPELPRSFKADKTVTVRGTIHPRHATGSPAVTVKVWKLTGASWSQVATLTATIVSPIADGSRWTTTFRAGSAGVYALRAYHADAEHAASNSLASVVRVTAADKPRRPHRPNVPE